jgi:eukaryotic-like serine/threonine-protein kinase
MLKPGDTFERYTIEAPLGQGGMGCVYRAHDARLGRRVALKVISDAEGVEAEADARLLREARAAAALDHPNVVSIFDVGEHEGTPYIVMELVDGRTLRAGGAGEGGASPPVAARVSQRAPSPWRTSAGWSTGTSSRRT